MTPMDYQLQIASEGLTILRKYAICYLAMEERTRKTLIAILMAEEADVQRILVITKKKALEGWGNHFDKFPHTKNYVISTYQSLHKVQGKFDLVICDESHNFISSFPKRSSTWKKVRNFTFGLPIIYISATPHAQTYAQLYHQFALSDWSPFKRYSTFYNWHRTYGTGETKWINMREVACYEKVKDNEIHPLVDHLFITKTRAELGFTEEPTDQLHYVELGEKTKKYYNELVQSKVIDEPFEIIADTTMIMRTSLHQLEGGTIKVLRITAPATSDDLVKVRKERVTDEDGMLIGVHHHCYYVLTEDAKIQYILDNFGDSDKVVIMYNYIAEGFKLREVFKHAMVLQATSYAEGVDLSHMDHLIIYSQDFSTARHTQRRARQTSYDREHPIVVHYLLVVDGISEQVYTTVTINKQNYVDSRFERKTL